MGDYFVRLAGSDANNGQSAESAWRTVAKAVSVAVAGDTVYIGAGVYRESLTLPRSGSSAQPIRFVGDFTGVQTGDAGPVILTPQTNDGSRFGDLGSYPDYVLNLGAAHHVEFQQLHFGYGAEDSVVAEGGVSLLAGVVFADCVFWGPRGWDGARCALHVTYTQPVQIPAGEGLRLTHCTFHGPVRLEYDESVAAQLNLKVTIAHCVFLVGDVRNHGAVQIKRRLDATYAVGGVTVHNCLLLGGPGPLVELVEPASTLYAYRVYNNLLVAVDGAPLEVSNAVGSPRIEADYNVPAQADGGQGVRGLQAAGLTLLGGLADYTLRRFWGWSPWRPFEPMVLPGLPATTLATAQADYNLSADRYGVARRTGPGTYAGYFATAATPQGGWVNPAAISAPAPAGDAWTDTSLAHLLLTGFTDAGQITADQDIEAVSLHGRYRFTALGSTLQVTAVSSGVTLGSGMLTPATTQIQEWRLDLSAPASGWSKAKLQTLGVDLWRSDGAGRLHLYAVLAYVRLRRAGGVGPVYPHRLAERETGVRQGNSGYSLRLAGAGSHTLLQRLYTGLYRAQVAARRSSAYSGVNPTLEVTDLRSGQVWSSALSAAANTWQTLSVDFSVAGYSPVRVRLVSYDSSRTGVCYWDNLTISVR